MKQLFITILIITGCNLYSQQLIILDDETKEPVPFVTVLLTKEGKTIYGDYCNNNGMITLVNDKDFDAVTLKSVGYKEVNIPKIQLKDGNIYMDKIVYQLEDVVITNKADAILGYLDEQTPKQLSGVEKGGQTAVYIENTYGVPVTIKSFLFNAKKVKQRFVYRLHFYTPSANKLYPVNEITTTDIICYIEKGTKGPVEINVWEFGIEMPAEGVYVSIEGIGACDEQGNIIENAKYYYFNFEAHQSASKVYCFQPSWTSTGWINYNDWFPKDYIKTTGKPVKAEWLKVPSFGLKVMEP